MAVNWAMVGDDGKSLVLLPEERVFYRQDGVRFELETGGGYPGNLGTYVGPTGYLYLSNQRVAFINAQQPPSSSPSSSGFQSMSIPIGNISDGVFKQPWFSANCYEATVMPVHNGGLRAPGRMKLIFKEGGGYEFSRNFELLRERIHESEGTQVIEHLEELPAYGGNSGPDSGDVVILSSPLAPEQSRFPEPTPPAPQNPVSVMPSALPPGMPSTLPQAMSSVSPLVMPVAMPQPQLPVQVPSPTGSDRAPSAPPPAEGLPPSYEQATLLV